LCPRKLRLKKRRKEVRLTAMKEARMFQKIASWIYRQIPEIDAISSSFTCVFVLYFVRDSDQRLRRRRNV